MASMQNDTEMMECLINKKSNQGKVALLIAARDNRLQSLSFLLAAERKESLNLTDGDYIEAITLAIKIGRDQSFDCIVAHKSISDNLITYLSERDNAKKFLIEAIESKNSWMTEKLIDFMNVN